MIVASRKPIPELKEGLAKHDKVLFAGCGTCEAILSLGWGAGVQAIAGRFPDKPVYAALNTQFLGILEEQAVWAEKCLGCGSCLLSDFGGICPITRCAKRLLNGPCAGSTEERCEVSPDRPCAWQLPHGGR